METRDVQRSDYRGDAQNEAYVEYVGTDDVAQRELRVALDCCDDCRGEFGQRGSYGHHRDGDDGFADAERQCDAARAADEPPSAESKSRDAEQNEQDGFPQGRTGAGLCRLCRFRSPFGCCPERVSHVAGEECEQQDTLPPGDDTAGGVVPESESETHEEEDECDEDVVRNVYPFGGGTDADGLYQGCRSEYQQRIGQVRADDIAYRHASFAFDTRDEAHDQLRHRGADAHDGESDEKFGHPVAFGDRYRAVDQAVGPRDDEDESQNQ